MRSVWPNREGGNLIRTTDAAGAQTVYTYDTEGQLLTTTDALNHVTSYTYDAFGNVSSITQADGTIYQYNYNAAGQLLSQTDPTGTVTVYTYDVTGQVSKTEVRDRNVPKALGHWLETAQTFDGIDDKVTIENTDQLNFSGEITLSAWVKIEETGGYRGILEHGYYGGREVFLRIASGKYQVGIYQSKTNSMAEAAVASEDIGAWVHIVGTYDGSSWNLYKNGELIASSPSTVGVLPVNCDWLIGGSQATNRCFKGEIRDAGIWNVAMTPDEVSTHYTQGFSQAVVNTATYDAVGNILTQTDAMGNTTSYTYDTMGRVLTVTDALNNVTSYTYDALGRLLTTTDARGTVTRNTYDAVGNLLQTKQYDSTELPPPVGTWLDIAQEFDGSSTINLGNPDNLNFSGEIAVSAWVKIDTTGGIKTILGHGPSGGKEVYLRLNGNSYQFGSWDSATNNHLVSATIPAEDIGAWVHLVGTYDGVNWNLYKNGELLASRADTVGCVPLTTNWYIGSSNGNARFFDGEIRDVSIWNTSLTASQAAAVYAETAPSADYPTVVTSYTYDALNRLTSLTDPVGNTTSYTYDYRGLVLTETNEKNSTRYYTYDALGRLISKTDRNDRVTTYTYDSVGRLTAEHWGDTTDYFMYTYDLVGNLLYATDGDHSYSYTYDALYRPIYTSFNFDSQSAVFSYTYDAVGRQTSSSLTLNGHADRVNTTTYDYLGNATSIRQHGNITDEIFAEFDYNTNGLLTSVRRYEKDDDTINEIAESLYEYNSNNAVTSITHNNASGSQIVKHSYTYDETNNIVEYLNSIDGSTSYDYDFLGQLISADSENLTDESYTYDANGNRILANGESYSTGQNNELTSDGDYTYTYDAEGNRTSKTNSTNRELYTWDYRNRLTTVTQQEWDSVEQDWTTTQIVEYAYDYNNVWIRKIVGENKTIFIPENYQTTVQIDNNAVTHHYLWTPHQQDKLLADTTSTDVLWSLTDHLGTVRDVLGTTSTHLIYDTFGNLTSGTNPLLFGYTGKAFDFDTDLQNNINRWYDATVGRWLSTDPIGFHGKSLNLYRYVQNEPLHKIDWSGLEDVPYWTSFLPSIDFDAGDCLLILYNGHGTLDGKTDIIPTINLGYATVPAAEVPHDFQRFWDDVEQLGYIRDNVFFAFIGCWPDFINTEKILPANQMRLKNKPLLQPNGDDMLPTRLIPKRLTFVIKRVLPFVKEKIKSGCCESVTFFIVNSAEGYIPHQYGKNKTIYLKGVRFDIDRAGRITREIVE